MSHADILDIDRGHIFRKHSHENNKKKKKKKKKNHSYLRENGKKKPTVTEVFASQLLTGERTFIARF